MKHSAYPCVIVMGISGCGKSTLGALLAERTGRIFLDADDYHTKENKARMKSGIALTDEDRAQWLADIGDAMKKLHDAGTPFVLACSALKKKYRAALASSVFCPQKMAHAAPRDGVLFIYLHIGKEEAEARMRARSGHFMPASLVQSQLDALEEPQDAEAVSFVRIEASEEVEKALARCEEALA